MNIINYKKLATNKETYKFVNKERDYYKRGYTLGMTMIIVSVVLLLTMSIYSLMYSEFKVIGIGDKSSKAYYNADIGIECVKFYENQYTEPGSNPNALASVTNGGVASSGFFLAVGPDQIGYSTNQYSLDTGAAKIECGGDTTITNNKLNTDNVTIANPVYVTLPNMPGSFFLTKFKIKNVALDLCTDVKVYKTITNINALTVVSTGYSSCLSGGGPRISREIVYQKGFIN